MNTSLILEGKTFLSSTIIRHLQTAKRNVIFAYLLYTDSNAGNRLGIIHSFIFQLILDNKDLRPILIEEYNTNYRQMSSSVEFAQKLLQSILSSIGLTFVVVDGLDEVNQTERQALLKFLLQIAEDCPDLRLLIAGRDEFDIARVVKKKVQLVYIAKQNSQDIKLYVKDIGGEFIRSQPFDMSIISELEEKLDEVSVMADGMDLRSPSPGCFLNL